MDTFHYTTLTASDCRPLPAGRPPQKVTAAKGWSDASCSGRFYDYGSAQMAQEVARAPDKAGRWRTAEVEAAWTFADLLECAEQPPMEAEADGAAEAAEAAAAAAAAEPVEEAEMVAAEAAPALEVQLQAGGVAPMD